MYIQVCPQSENGRTSMPTKFSFGRFAAISIKLSPEPNPMSKLTAPGFEKISSNLHLVQHQFQSLDNIWTAMYTYVCLDDVET